MYDVIWVFSFLTHVYWILGSFIYSIKFISPWFNEITSYGKLLPSHKQGLIPHDLAWPFFYVFGATWNVCVILFEIYLSWIGIISLQRVLPFSILLQIQVTRRAIECLFVHKYSDNRMTVFQFISGLSFYGASSFCVMEMMLPSSPELFSSLQLHHILAVIVFIISSCIQMYTHIQLAKLRNVNKNSTTKQYYIPHGIFFSYVSCPHYSAEILIYLSFIIYTGGRNISICLEMLFVIMNISHNAIRTHKWYNEKFEDYPKQRKAIIPFIL